MNSAPDVRWLPIALAILLLRCSASDQQSDAALLEDATPSDEIDADPEEDSPLSEATDGTDRVPTDVPADDGPGDCMWEVSSCGPECTEVDNCGEPFANVCDLRCYSTEGRCVHVGPDPTCPDDDSPVCGCDGVTYRNDCERLLARQRFKHDGACTEYECPFVCVSFPWTAPWDGSFWPMAWEDPCTGRKSRHCEDCTGCWVEPRPHAGRCAWFSVCSDGRIPDCYETPLLDYPDLLGLAEEVTECGP